MAIRYCDKVIKDCPDYTQEAEFLKKKCQEQLNKNNGGNTSFSPNSILLYSEGGTVGVKFTKTPSQWSVKSVPNWLTAEKSGSKTLTITATPNPNPTERKGKIELSSGKKTYSIEVTQKANEDYLIITPNSSTLHFESIQETKTLTVSCSHPWVVDCDCPSWLTISFDDNTITITCQENKGITPRSASFRVASSPISKSETIQVTQAGAAPNIHIRSPKSHSYTLDGKRRDMVVTVETNLPQWNYQVLSDEAGWVTPTVKTDNTVTLHIETNPEKDHPRTARLVVGNPDCRDTLELHQEPLKAYPRLLYNYFDDTARVWKNTHFFLELYGLQTFGIRMGGLAKRWKYVEASMLNFDFEFEQPNFDFKNEHPLLKCDWEPVVRGYLPISGPDQRWSLFIGMGISVNLMQFDLKSHDLTFLNGCHFLFEAGGEFHWKKRDNVSSRVFYRYDGHSSIGFSFDIHHWKPSGIRPGTEGYKGLLRDYFDNNNRAWKTTHFFFDIYALECAGIRLGGFAKRWKFVEVSLISFNIQYDMPKLYFDWEPIVRGFLPVSRTPERWAVFAGMGLSVNILRFDHEEMAVTLSGKANVLFEMGAEYHWKRRPNVSSRIFYRFDGYYSSIGYSFDLHKWTTKWN